MPNLSLIETIDSLEHSRVIERELVKSYPGRVVKAFLQVNTSREANKHGISPDLLLSQFEAIKSQCPHIEVIGLMTIGSVEESLRKDGTNRDFQVLRQLKETLETVADQPFQLSMGMSEDFEQAVLATFRET